ncbi:MAG: hypothetical protein U0929_16400 [Planctomycetaceae bacterium]
MSAIIPILMSVTSGPSLADAKGPAPDGLGDVAEGLSPEPQPASNPSPVVAIN